MKFTRTVIFVATVKLLLLTSVLITFDQWTLAPCPLTPRSVVRQEDGTYRESLYTTSLVACGRQERWQEEWTDYPEKGGVFIRRVGA